METQHDIRKKAIIEVAAAIGEGRCPSPEAIAERYGVTKSCAYRYIGKALALCSSDDEDSEFDYGNSRRFRKPRRIVVPADAEFAGGFRTLTIKYGTMWGKPWGYVSKTYDVRGEFQGGKLRAEWGERIAEDMAALAREKWDGISDLTAEAVLADLRTLEIIRKEGEPVEEGFKREYDN